MSAEQARPDAEPDADEVLLARVAGGDVDALAALYDRHRSIAYGLALRVTGSVPAAEDVLQDAFLGLWRHAGRFDPARGSGRTWLLAIVHNRAVDAVRHRRLADPLPDEATDPLPALIAPDVWPEVAGRLDAALVRKALAALPDAQREAIELAYWGGLTQTEIAARTGQPLGTVKGRMRLGLRALGQALADGPAGSGRPPEAPSATARTGGRPALDVPAGTSGALRDLARRLAGAWRRRRLPGPVRPWASS